MLPTTRTNAVFAPASMGPANRLDSFFDRVLDDGFLPGRAWSGAPVAMWEDEDHIWVEAELPGLADKDVDLTVHNGMLIIRAERKPEEGRRYLYNTRSFGRFERVITLPEAVQVDAVRATLTDGILRVELPKSPEAKPRKIELRSS